MTILLDVNLSPDWVSVLNKSGIAAFHWSTVSNTDAPDTEIVAYAVAFHCVILTQDLDFGTILASSRAARPSVIQIKAGRANPVILGPQVVAALKALQAELHEGAFVTIDLKRTRLAILPFRER